MTQTESTLGCRGARMLIWAGLRKVPQFKESKRLDIPHRQAGNTCRNHKAVIVFTIFVIIQMFYYHQLALAVCFKRPKSITSSGKTCSLRGIVGFLSCIYIYPLSISGLISQPHRDLCGLNSVCVRERAGVQLYNLYLCPRLQPMRGK